MHLRVFISSQTYAENCHLVSWFMSQNSPSTQLSGTLYDSHSCSNSEQCTRCIPILRHSRMETKSKIFSVMGNWVHYWKIAKLGCNKDLIFSRWAAWIKFNHSLNEMLSDPDGQYWDRYYENATWCSGKTPRGTWNDWKSLRWNHFRWSIFCMKLPFLQMLWY